MILFRNDWRLAVCICLLPLSIVAAGEKGTEGDEHAPPPRVNGPDGLPLYKHPYSDGLYSTLTAMNMFYAPDVKKQKKIKLAVEGFHKDVPVQVIMQDYKAPLIVVLLGVDGKVEGPWGGIFPYWYSEAGYHVITFDSTFTPQYPDICRQGVVGNFDAETDQCAAIVAAFLKTPGAKAHVTTVGVVGISFGATQALIMAAKSKAHQLPFELSGCLAISPPVNLRTTARIVDRFFSEDRWQTTMIDLAKRFGPHVPVAEGQPIPFKDTEMRAAIGYVFRDGLTKVVERNDRAYKLKILPSEESGEDRSSYAEAVGMTRFIEQFSFPYWEKKGVVKNAGELWDMASLEKLLPRVPAFAQAVIAENDPFNLPGEIEAAKAADVNHCLIVQPNGGHLGFASADWTLVKALRIFRWSDASPLRGAAPEAPADGGTTAKPAKKAGEPLGEFK